MMDRDESCAARVRPMWEQTRADLRRMLIDNEPEEGYEDGTDEFCDYGLSFDYVAPGTFENQEAGYFRFQMSTGGPGDELRFYAGRDNDLHCAEYWFLDWFDGAHLDVTSSDEARAVWDWFADVGTVDHAYQEGRE